MKRTFLGIWFVTSLTGCHKMEHSIDSNHIVLVGEAINMKGGVGIMSENTMYEFDVDSIYAWDEMILNKRIRVEGELFVEILPPRPPRDTINVPPPPPPQRGAYDFELVIKNPRWIVLE